MNNDNILCVIPARSGSKGVIDKNIRDFNGKPLLIHSLEYAMKCEEIDNVIISLQCILHTLAQCLIFSTICLNLRLWY